MPDINELHGIEAKARRAYSRLTFARHGLLDQRSILKMLPGVSMGKAVDKIAQLRREMFQEWLPLVESSEGFPEDVVVHREPVAGCIITFADWMHIEVDGKTTPRGARILLRLYRGGWLPMKRSAPPSPAPAVRAYAKSTKALVAAAEKETADHLKAVAAINTRQIEPLKASRLRKKDFRWHNLERVFIDKPAPPAGLDEDLTMTIDGIQVTRRHTHERTVTGEIKGVRVTFHWADEKGKEVVARRLPSAK